VEREWNVVSLPIGLVIITLPGGHQFSLGHLKCYGIDFHMTVSCRSVCTIHHTVTFCLQTEQQECPPSHSKKHLLWCGEATKTDHDAHNCTMPPIEMR